MTADEPDGIRSDADPAEEGAEPGRARAERFRRSVDEKATRKRRARRRRYETVWFGLGMFGLVGWSVAIPTLAGVALGVWLDSRGGGLQSVSWTLTGLIVGVAVGCALAWYWVRQEAGREDVFVEEDTPETDTESVGHASGRRDIVSREGTEREVEAGDPTDDDNA